MAEEADAKEIEDLALKEIGRRPDGSDRFERRLVAGQANFQPHTLFALHGEQVISQFKARFARDKSRRRSGQR